MKENYLNLKPEDELVLLCARTQVDKKTEERINELVQNNLNWNYIIISSCKNKVNKLIYHHLNKICPQKIPVKYSKILSENFHKKGKYKLFQSAELFRILKLLESNNITAIPYKGPILAHLAYRNLALRKLDDTTLIININDIQKTKEIFQSQGYELKYKPDPQKEQLFIRSVREYIFLNNKGFQIKIKWNYLKNSFSSPYDLENLWKSKKLKFGSFEYYNPSLEDLLLILCIESAKMQWSRLRYISDIAGVIQNSNNINWTDILNKSKKYRLEKIMFINLYLTKKFLGIKYPNKILNKINSDFVKNTSNQIISKLFNDEEYQLKIRREHYENAFLRFHIRENKFDGFKDYVKTITSSSPYKLNFSSSKFSQIINQSLQFIKEKSLSIYPKIDLQVPYVTTPIDVIKRMFELADLGPEDIVYDLGCGDGRIVIAAAKDFGAQGVGIDIDSKRIEESIRNARLNGVKHLTTFIEKDIMESDISNATVVTTYLLPSVNRAIMPELKKQLKPNSRIVTQEFTMGNWTPIKTDIITYQGYIIPLYLYKT